MASTKALRDTFGLSQQEIAYFIGASRFQVSFHERTLKNLADKQDLVLKRVILLFQPFKDKPELPDIPNGYSVQLIREMLISEIGDLKHEINKLGRDRERLKAAYLNTKIQQEVLKQLMGQVSPEDENLFDCLKKINSIIHRKMRRYGPEKQLLLTIKIESLLKQIEVNEDFLNHELLNNYSKRHIFKNTT